MTGVIEAPQKAGPKRIKDFKTCAHTRAKEKIERRNQIHESRQTHSAAVPQAIPVACATAGR